MFDFDTFFKAIITHLQGEFPTVPTVEEYPRIRTKVPAPSILIEMADATPIEDPGTEQLALSCRFEARVVYDQAPTEQGQKPDTVCLALAASLAQVINKAGRFGQKVGPARDIRIEPDKFKPELAGYAVWLVEWTHEIRLGDSVWDGSAVPVTEVYVGLSPDIGTGNEANYVEVTGG